MRISLLPNVGSGSQVPSLAKEGWLRHQKDAAKPPSPAQTGWLVPKKLFWSFNEPPRPRLSLEREFFLMARPPPPLPRRGVCSDQAFSKIKCVYFTGIKPARAWGYVLAPLRGLSLPASSPNLCHVSS